MEHLGGVLGRPSVSDFPVHIVAYIIFSTSVMGIEMVGFWFGRNRKTAQTTQAYVHCMRDLTDN